MIDSITDADMFKGIASLVTGGAFVGWYREHRRGKKDAYTFAIDMIGTLSARMDSLVAEVAILKAENTLAADAFKIISSENVELKTENTRLRTALGEHRRRENHEQGSFEPMDTREVTSGAWQAETISRQVGLEAYPDVARTHQGRDELVPEARTTDPLPPGSSVQGERYRGEEAPPR